MMGVMRYKSTGDMLAASSRSEQFARRRGAGRSRIVRADSEEDVDLCCGTNDDDDDSNNNHLEEHEELARTSRPLLFRASSAYNGGGDDGESDPQIGRGSKRHWRSCKLLGDTSRWTAANYHDDLEGKQAVRRQRQQHPAADGSDLADEFLASRQFRKQLSKSTGDFLAALVLSQEPRNTSQPSRAAAATRVKLHSDQRDCGDDEASYDGRLDWFPAPMEAAAPTIAASSLARPFVQSSSSTVRPAKLSGKNLANSRLVSKCHRRASGARNKRRRAQATQRQAVLQQQQVNRPRTEPSWLSLSSPALAQAKQRDKGQVIAGVGQMATLTSTGGAGLKYGNSANTDCRVRGCEASGQDTDDAHEVCADAADDTVLRRQQQGSPVTLPVASAAADRYGGETKSTREHCIVDAAQILEQRQQGRGRQACQTGAASGQVDEASCGGHCDNRLNFVAAASTTRLSGSRTATAANDDNRRLEERLLSVCDLGGGLGQLVASASATATNAAAATNPTTACPFSIFGEQSARVAASSDFVSPAQPLPSFHNHLQQQRECQHGSYENSEPPTVEKSKLVGAASAAAYRQQQENSKSTTAATLATATAGGSITNKLIVDLNSAANRLMDTCCNSWLGQTLQPNHFGSYKVSQPAPGCAPISGLQNSLALQREGNALATVAGCQQHQHGQHLVIAGPDKGRTNSSGANSMIAHYSRPGRSPVSLQRQTNARLARHRLKIQQQRREQLTQSALRERRQLSMTASSGGQAAHSIANLRRFATQGGPTRIAHCQQHQAPSTLEGALASHTQRRSSENRQLSPVPQGASSSDTSGRQQLVGQESLHLINGLLERLSYGRLSGRVPSTPPATAQQQASHQRQELLDTLQVNRLQATGGQHQVIEVPAERDRQPTEICDSQLAGSSRQRSSSSTDGKRASQHSSGGNVIVYKSINMLQNKRCPMGTSQRRQRGHARNTSKKHGTEFEFDDDEGIESDSQTIRSGDSTVSLNRPFCKICHLGSAKSGDKLISPCRCSGTMQYIHCGCLLKWLEISNRSNEKPISCELCAHEYTWHKKFNYKQMRLPRCSVKDSILHVVFVLAIGVMFFSALAPMVYKRPPTPLDATTTAAASSNGEQQAIASHGGGGGGGGIASEMVVAMAGGDITPANYHATRGFRHHNHNGQSGSARAATRHSAPTSRLAQDEKFMLLCAASFFASFFVAIYVQTKARDTLYGLIVKFLSMNKTYYITEYDHGQLNGTNSGNNSNGATCNGGGSGGSSNSGSNNNSGNCNGCGSSCGVNDCDGAGDCPATAAVNGSNGNTKMRHQLHQQSQCSTNTTTTNTAGEDSRLDRKSLQKS